jgi:hypothetical protein
MFWLGMVGYFVVTRRGSVQVDVDWYSSEGCVFLVLSACFWWGSGRDRPFFLREGCLV